MEERARRQAFLLPLIDLLCSGIAPVSSPGFPTRFIPDRADIPDSFSLHVENVRAPARSLIALPLHVRPEAFFNDVAKIQSLLPAL